MRISDWSSDVCSSDLDSCRLNFATSRNRKASRRTTRGYDSRKLLRQIFVGCDRKYDLPALPAGCLIGGCVEGPIVGIEARGGRVDHRICKLDFDGAADTPHDAGVRKPTRKALFDEIQVFGAAFHNARSEYTNESELGGTK